MNDLRSNETEVIVIGGGPAGAAIARLLAARGRSVRILSAAPDTHRCLGESLPPSARKSLAALGVLDAVEKAGFCTSRGNRVAWGADEPRLERFDGDAGTTGFQVWRPTLDRLLLEHAVAAGARFDSAVVRRVDVTSDARVEVGYTTHAGATGRARTRFVVDASGRAGVIARKSGRRAHPVRTHAWIGLWRHEQPLSGWELETTLVESADAGWAWSVPVSPTLRCAAVMVDPDRTSNESPGSHERRYQNGIARTRLLREELVRATLIRAWGADATPYDTTSFGGPRHLVVGDAACFIDPLSSFGVKKALASAWNAAAVVETCLSTPDLQAAAIDFFAAEERAVYESQLAQSAKHASRARAAHQSEFWTARTFEAAVDQSTSAAGDPERVKAAFEALRAEERARVRRSASARFTMKAAIKGHAIALERAVTAASMPVAVRYLESVDLPTIVDLAADGREVGELFDRYCRTAAPVPLPSFLKALSVLVAGQALEAATC